MQTMTYAGLVNVSECQYAIGEDGGKKLVLGVWIAYSRTRIAKEKGPSILSDEGPPRCVVAALAVRPLLQRWK